ncbi:MAG: VTT domain-containing protein [bacterium]|nr:VTT domain-containing protein [bacterium]
MAGTILTVIFLLPIFSTEYLHRAVEFIKLYPVFAPIIIILLRFSTAVLAPLPGLPISFASIAVLPWWEAWVYNFIGMELGLVAAFFIARKFREPAVRHFAPLEKVHAWQEKISHRKQFWGFAGLRFGTIYVCDFVSYAAGLSRLSFSSFLIITLMIDIPLSLIFFFFGGIALRYGVYIFVGFILLSVLTMLGWKYFKGKKLE